MLRRCSGKYLAILFRVACELAGAVECAGRCAGTGSVDQVEDVDLDILEELEDTLRSPGSPESRFGTVLPFYTE